MHRWKLLCLLLTLPLAGCLGTSEAETAAKKAELAAKDDEVCKGYGAKPGSDIYIQCRMAQAKRSDDADNAVTSSPTIINNTTVEAPAIRSSRPSRIPALGALRAAVERFS